MTAILRFIAPFALLVSVNIFWLLSSWPISMSPDSLNVWSQIQNGVYQNDHPVTYTIFVKIFSLGGNYLSLVSAVQLSILSIGILSVSYSLSRNFLLSMVITSLVMITPTAGALASTLWKDVPFVGLLLIGFSLLVKNHTFFGLIFITLGASLRHNGWTLLLAIAIFMTLFLILKNYSLRRYLWVIITSAVLSFSIIFLSAKLLDAKSTSTWLTWSPALADLAYIASRTPNNNSEIHETVALYSTGDSLARSADCTNINGMVYYPGFNEKNIDKNLGKILREFLDLAKSDPKLILRLHSCRAQAFLPPPLSSGPGYFYWTQMIIMEPNDYSLTPSPPIPLVRELGLKVWSVWDSQLKILLWPGLIVLVASFLFFIYLRIYLKQINDVWLFWFVSMWGALISIIPWSAAQDFRYALFSYLIAQIIIFITAYQVFHRIKIRVSVKN
jgi:hypothetical protein